MTFLSDDINSEKKVVVLIKKDISPLFSDDSSAVSDGTPLWFNEKLKLDLDDSSIALLDPYQIRGKSF